MGDFIALGTVRVDELGKRYIVFHGEEPPAYVPYQPTQDELDKKDLFYLNKWLRIHIGRELRRIK